jgi:hypothetical protein
MNSNLEEPNKEPNIIINKKSLKVIKNERNNYTIIYNIKNENIYLPKIIDFSILKIIYEINRDVFEDYNIEMIDENEANIYFLVKHYFKELGMPKRYIYLNTKIIRTTDNIDFYIKIIDDKMPNINTIHSDATILPIENMHVNCNIKNQHNVFFINNILFFKKFEIPEFIEKFSLTLFSKMFIRTKQFIENIK